MARHFEYIIHGPPLSPDPHAPKRNKTLPSRHHRQDSSLRILYRSSASPSDLIRSVPPREEQDIPTPTTPRLPLTPPEPEADSGILASDPVDIIPENSDEKQRSLTVTPVNQHSPPTPETTPPRDAVKLPHTQILNVRPSIASTRAESFATAHENILSEDELDHSSPETPSALISHQPPLDSLIQNGHVQPTQLKSESEDAKQNHQFVDDDDSDTNRPSTTTPSHNLNATQSASTSKTPTVAPSKAQLPLASTVRELPNEVNEASTDESIPRQIGHAPRRTSIHEQVTVNMNELANPNKSLRDRVEETKQIQHSASTEKFASIIGWNDNVRSINPDGQVDTQRWSGISNISAVEAYVVESPIKPQRRGTLRKVVKNDSLRSVSSPLPDSKRTSLQSNSDSPHQLVHKKQKLNDNNRWSVDSDISKRSVSQGSILTRPKAEIIRVTVIPEGSSSLHSSPNSSRRQSRSISGSSGRDNSSLPPVTTPKPRRKRAFSDSNDRSSVQHVPQIPSRSSSISASTSRTRSRANSAAWDPFSAQRQQAEKDLRSTLDRMESERLSSSLRQASNQSTPMQTVQILIDEPHDEPPDEPRNKVHNEPNKELLDTTRDEIQDGIRVKSEDASHAVSKSGIESEPHNETVSVRKISIVSDSARSSHRPFALDISGITPGTKEWADLRNTELIGTPFSQPSMLSASPEIVEAKVINFFPHNNESLQLIEPYRLSESQAVRALKAEHLNRSNTAPTLKTNASPKNALIIRSEQFQIESPLRNPRKPPQPPHFNVIPPTPLNELDQQLGVTPDTSPVKIRTVRKRPSLQGRHRSESFVKAFSKSLSLRNARNPKAGAELDSTLHPFWRPRAFWDDEEYAERIRREQEQLLSLDYADRQENVPRILEQNAMSNRGIKRSNTLTLGPASLMRRISERRKQRRAVDEHLAAQQALVKQASYSSLHRFNMGRRFYAFPGRTLSLNVGLDRLRSLQDRVASMRARREEEKRERRREALRKSIGVEVISQGDSRYWDRGNVGASSGTRESDLQRAQAEALVEKRGLRM